MIVTLDFKTNKTFSKLMPDDIMAAEQTDTPVSTSLAFDYSGGDDSGTSSVQQSQLAPTQLNSQKSAEGFAGSAPELMSRNRAISCSTGTYRMRTFEHVVWSAKKTTFIAQYSITTSTNSTGTLPAAISSASVGMSFPHYGFPTAAYPGPSYEKVCCVGCCTVR